MRRARVVFWALFIAWIVGGGWVAAQEAAETGELDEVRSAIESLRSQTIEALENVVDPAQLATQATEEQIGQGQPRLEEQFVYSVSPWNGIGYPGTFSAQQAPTIFLMADETSIVNAQRTKVYFWPITGEFMADWQGMNEPVPGVLEVVQGGKVVQTLERTDYSYHFPSGHGSKQQLYLGEEARRIFEDYKSRIDAFYDATSKYYEEYREWQVTMDRLLKEVQETGVYKDPDEIPPAPKQPTPPTDYAYAPRSAFAVNLPAGNYEIRLRGPDGNIVDGSVRRLEVFAPRRTGVTFEMIPAHRWTRRMFSQDASQVFYQNGERIFYLIPNHAKEFNFYQFVKMANLHKPLEGEGTRSAWTWAPFGELTEGILQIVRDGEVIETVERRPYYVKQTPGFALGYDIVDFDPVADPSLANRSPTFEAYKIAVPADGPYQIRMVDASGAVIEGSVREIRPIHEPGAGAYYVSLIPLVVGGAMFAWRRGKRARK